jgi:hypothetical protein
VHVSGTQTIPASHVIEGCAPFNLITRVPEFASAKSAGCPNNKWKAGAKDVVFSSFTIWVKQGNHVLLKQTMRP